MSCLLAITSMDLDDQQKTAIYEKRGSPTSSACSQSLFTVVTIGDYKGKKKRTYDRFKSTMFSLLQQKMCFFRAIYFTIQYFRFS